jgi:signal transduction histidine kinase
VKLIKIINRQYISYSMAIIFIAGILLFLVLKAIVKDEIDEKLVNSFKQIELLQNNLPEELEIYPYISVKLNNTNLEGQFFSDTTLMVNKELEKYRQLLVYTSIQGKNYTIAVRDLGLESNDLMTSLFLILLLSFAGLLLAFYLINKRISKKVWLPFFENMEKLKKFSIQSGLSFIPTESNILEFIEMNKVLKSLTDKVMSDYENLKRFSENASHELQTPLAIIRTKIEALLNENELSPNQIEKINAVYQSVNRLSKINSGLLLLTKIENRQFVSEELVSIKDLIQFQMENFTEMMGVRQLEVKYNLHADWKIYGNKVLLELLLTNLFSNAILHNLNKGEIVIDLSENQLKMANSGKSPILDSDQVFERFYKGKESGSTGLGLAISKQICSSQNLNIHYGFDADFHIFTIETCSA